MKTVQFLSKSIVVESIVKGLTLTRSLFVSSILVGEKYTGKKTLIKDIFPNSVFVDANDATELESVLDLHDKVVIYNFEAIKNLENLNLANKQIIAIANKLTNTKLIENLFAFIYTMPPLSQREEDIKVLTSYYSTLIKDELMVKTIPDIDLSKLDLSQNNKSLKASIYKAIITKTLNKDDIENLFYSYLLEHIKGDNAYRENLPLFEKPLIKAGLKKYKSQLKLSGVLGLNRNTLRKKIHELNLD